MATREKGWFWSQTLATTDETDTAQVYSTSGGHRGCTFFVYSASVAGTAKVYYVDPNGNEREMDSQAYTAGTLLVMDYDFTVPQAILKVTGGSGSSTAVSVEAVAY